MKRTLVFDYDGTIHDTMAIYGPAFREGYAWLTENGYAPRQDIPDARIAGWLGMNSRDMWDSFLPELPDRIKEEVSARVGRGMVERIGSHQARWYSGAKEALDKLRSDGYTMVVLSNCKKAYREANWEEFGMARWFREFYDCESYGFAPKTEIIREICKRFAPPYIIIGDRRSDMDCAAACKAPFIGCRYGFGRDGELQGADLFADLVTDLPERIRTLCISEEE